MLLSPTKMSVATRQICMNKQVILLDPAMMENNASRETGSGIRNEQTPVKPEIENAMMASTILQNRAEELSVLIEEKTMDEKHIVRIMLNFDDLTPPDEKTGIPSDLCKNMPGHLLLPYEDAGMATGAYLAAESLHFRMEESPDALRRAKKAFQAICHIYELGMKGCSEGFFPKPYGGKYSANSSRDQYLFAMSGLFEYYQIAPKSEREQIRRMLAKMTEYWRTINYSLNYFSLGKNCQLYDYIAPMFLGIACLPGRLENSPECEKEVERLLFVEKLGDKAVDTLTAKYRRGETYDGACYFRQNENPMMMKSLAMDHLWNAMPTHQDLCRKTLENLASDELFLELSTQDSLNYCIMRYNPDTDLLELTPPSKIPELKNPLNLPFLNWGGDRRRAGSTQSVFAAIIAASHLNDPDLAKQAEKILLQLTREKFRGIFCSSPEHIPPGYEYMKRVLCCNYVCFWLWDYYLGKSRNLW